jgi:hypothetical protein
MKSIRIATDECAKRVARFWNLIQEEGAKLNLEIAVEDGCCWFRDRLRTDSLTDDWPFVASINNEDGPIEFVEIDKVISPEEFELLTVERASGKARRNNGNKRKRMIKKVTEKRITLLDGREVISERCAKILDTMVSGNKPDSCIGWRDVLKEAAKRIREGT